MKKIILYILTVLVIGSLQSQTKPNVILVLMDDVGFENITYNGGQSYSTPNIDLFALQAVSFTNCNSMPLCTPSRVMLLTGKYNFRNYTKWGELSDSTIANVLKGQGYSTGVFGKWQLGGWDSGIKKAGFDEYVVHDPKGSDSGSRYKNPVLYHKGEFIPNLEGKYGEDVVRDSMYKFIERNQTQPFFVYYPMMLAHLPFQPTPDDSAYATWGTSGHVSWYDNQMKYADKLIGQLINKIECMGLSDNTVIIISGDNGTPSPVTSMFNGKPIDGGKAKTIRYGTNVPLYVMWKGKSIVGKDNSLIDFSDIYAFIADISGSDIRHDGISFLHNIIGQEGKNKAWLYFDYNAQNSVISGGKGRTIWVMDKKYKLYDSIVSPYEFRAGKFYNYQSKPLEGKNNHIEASERTNYENNRYHYFKNILDSIANTK